MSKLVCGCEGPECRNIALLTELRAARMAYETTQTPAERLANVAKWLGTTPDELEPIAAAFSRGEIEEAKKMLDDLVVRRS